MKLAQTIAVHTGVKASVHKIKSELYRLIQKGELFVGFSKVFQPLRENDEMLPPESKRVAQQTADILATLRRALTDLWTTTIRLEEGNVLARGKVELPGVAVPEVPVTYLLFLEKELTDLRTFVENIPVLDAADDWQYDAGIGLYKTAPVQTHRTKTTQVPIVLYDATEHHPAQTQLIQDVSTVGHWQTVKHSGAMAPTEKSALAGRVEEALRAVKAAREGANSHQETPAGLTAHELILGYIFG